MTYQWDFSSILLYQNVLWRGLLGTLQLALLSTAMAMAVGLFVCLCRISSVWILRIPAVIVINFFRNIPFIVQLFWFYYAVPVLTGFQANAFSAALTALTLYGGAYFAEVFRAGVQSVDKGQWEGACAIGLSHAATLRHVVLPQALRRMIPPITTQIIELSKLTTVASTVAFFELLYAGKLVADQDFRPIEAYTTVAFVLISLFLVVSFLSAKLERRLSFSSR